MNKQRGFTIIELLIVIVVIAILATISTVSFNGIQQRARNTQMVTVAKAYQQALLLYAADGNPYPTTLALAPSFGQCLGNGYPSDRCWIGTNGNYKVEPLFDAVLKPYLNNTPSVPTKTYKITSVDDRSGVVYFPDRSTGFPHIYYLLEGINQNCQLSGAVATNVGIGGTATGCRIVLPQQ